MGGHLRGDLCGRRVRDTSYIARVCMTTRGFHEIAVSDEIAPSKTFIIVRGEEILTFFRLVWPRAPMDEPRYRAIRFDSPFGCALVQRYTRDDGEEVEKSTEQCHNGDSKRNCGVDIPEVVGERNTEKQ